MRLKKTSLRKKEQAMQSQKKKKKKKKKKNLQLTARKLYIKRARSSGKIYTNTVKKRKEEQTDHICLKFLNV